MAENSIFLFVKSNSLTQAYVTSCCKNAVYLIAVLFTGDEQALLADPVRSVGRGMKLPPICDILLPKAYYDELPAHTRMLSKSGTGRGQPLQKISDGQSDINSDLERPGENFQTSLVPQVSSYEVPVCADMVALDKEFPKLSRELKDIVLEEEQVSYAEACKKSRKTPEAQFNALK